MRLDVFLTEKLALTRTRIKDMIGAGHVLVNGQKAKPSLMIKKSMFITGEIPEKEPLSLVAQDIPQEILYEDDYFLAINKQADMVVHPSAGHSSGTLVNAVLAYLGRTGTTHGAQRIGQSTESIGHGEGCPTPNSVAVSAALRPGIVHRLDRGTTGVILIAKESRTQELLSEMFKERQVKKTYRAIVEGIPKRTEWKSEGNIGRHPVERKKMSVLKTGGRPAETEFKVLKTLRSFAYVEAYPKTGRTHQIRVHLAHAGHPIVGDEIYRKKARKLADRPLLHAYRIEFNHPVTGERMKIEAPVPADMEEFIGSW